MMKLILNVLLFTLIVLNAHAEEEATVDPSPVSLDQLIPGLQKSCDSNSEHIQMAYFLDGTTVNLGREKSLKEKLKGKGDVLSEVGAFFEKGAEDVVKGIELFLTSLGLLDGDGTEIGRVSEMFMGAHHEHYSRYWSGPGLLNFGLKVVDRDQKKLKLANPFLKNSTFIGMDAHNIICDDFRDQLKHNPRLKSYKIHLAGYSRGAIIALDVINRLVNITGCHFTGGKRPHVASLVMIDPVRTGMGILDPLSITWVKDIPPQMNRKDVLVLEKTIHEEDLQGWDKFVQLSILKTERYKGVHHRLIFGDGVTLSNGKQPGGALNERINHTQISQNQRAAVEMMSFMGERGACFSLPTQH